MNGNTYVILGYTIGLALLWGYAAALWVSRRRIRRAMQEATEGPVQGGEREA